MEVLQDTYKDTKIGRIPKDWEVMMLNEITNYKSSNLSLNKLEENTGKYKLYGASGMLKGIDFYQTDKESFAIVKDGSGFGNLLWCDKNSSILGTLGRITNKETSDLKFCFYLTHTIKFKRYMSGSTIPHLYYKDYGNIKLPVPPLPEQQKIAEILSTVDEQISTTQVIIDKSKELKKGLMQELFSEGIGHTEFKDTKIGRIPKDWEVSTLYEIRKQSDRHSFTGGPFGSDLKSSDYTDSGVRIIQLGNIGVGSFIDKSKIYTSEEKANQLISCNVYPNDIILAKMAPVARSCKVPSSSSRYVMCSDGIRLAVDTEKVDDNFIFHSLQDRRFRASAERCMVGTTRGRIGLNDLRNLLIPFPPLSEQQKIAAILSEADAKIEKEQTQKAQLEELKKGLMQQLLTGKKRVKV